MQAKSRIARLLAVALIVSLVLVACGGGETGKTWFNLPSVKVRVQEDGTARVWGFNIPQPILQPAMIQQFQAANVQKLEVRIGYNGIHVYTNGADLPYVAWEQSSVETLQGVLEVLPVETLPNGAMIANYLPWLRTIGLGVALDIPVASGAAPLTIERWKGETGITLEVPEEMVLGPMTVGSLVFDSEGTARIEGIPAPVFEQALGVSLPRLDANTLSILESLGIETFNVTLQPNGIDLALGEEKLPGVAYDSERLETLTGVLSAFVADPATLGMVQEVIPVLTATDVTVAVSFTGEPAIDTNLGVMTIGIEPDGSLSVLGMNVMNNPIVPADMVSRLQDANVQQLRLGIQPDGIAIVANDQMLPKIAWTEESLNTIAQLAGPLAGVDPDLITSLVKTVGDTGLDLRVSAPAAEGAEVIEIPDEIDMTIQPPADGGGIAPSVIWLEATYQDGQPQSIGGVDAETLAALGITLPSLPADMTDTLGSIGVQDLTIDTSPGALNILLDGETALSLQYDEPSLNAALTLAAPFLADTPLGEEAVATLLREQILPLAPTADLNIKLNLQ